jgi:chemotaxis protein methyltransferase CheR
MNDLQELEIELLLQAVFRRFGYDFREYAPASLKRRIVSVLRSEGLWTVSGLQEKVLHDPACRERFLLALSVTETALFRDPGYFLAFRRKAVPRLRTYPSLRVWHAGCATGEEVYSMAILLREENLYDRTRIYATDISEVVLERARAGTFPLSSADAYARSYREAGGKHRLADYYTVSQGGAVICPSLKENVTFSHHNLAVDGSFNDFHVVMCRNVMIYFTKPLRERVHRLLFDSLTHFGILGLGNRESLQFTPHEKDYEPLDDKWRLYQKRV